MAKEKTVKELREACKKAGITGYSKMTKDDLVAALKKGKKAKTPAKAKRASPKKAAKRGYAAKTVAELRAECKKRDIRGYTKLNRDELVAALKTGKAAAKPARAAKPKARRVMPYTYMLTSDLLDAALIASEREKYPKSMTKTLNEMFAARGGKREFAKLIFSYAEKDPDINLHVLVWRKGTEYICHHATTDDEAWEKMSQAKRHTVVHGMVGLMMVADTPIAFHTHDYLTNNRAFAKVWRAEILKGATTPTPKYVM